METYKLFTKEPIKSLEEIILREAIPLAREKLAKGLDNNQFTTTKQCILNNAPILIFRGLGLLRKRNEEGKVKQKVIKYLGSPKNILEKFKFWEEKH